MIKKRTAIIFQRAPIPIRQGADRRVAELLGYLSKQLDFLGLVVLDNKSKETELFCQERNISVIFLKTHSFSYQKLTHYKKRIDSLCAKISLPNPINALRFIYRKIYKGNKEKECRDPFWTICNPLIKKQIAAYVSMNRIDVVIVEYIWLAECVSNLPNSIVKLIDTHDIMHIRKASFSDKGHLNPEYGLVDRDMEIDILRLFDGIISIQEKERQLLSQMIPERPVLCVPSGGNIQLIRSFKPSQLNFHDKLAYKKIRNIRGFKFLYLGSNHFGNIITTKSLIEEVWPKILRSNGCSNAWLIVAGDICNAFSARYKLFNRIATIGYISDIEWLYDSIDVVINPVFSGTGLKIKTIDALSRKKLLITTPIGIEGMTPGVEKACIIARSHKEMVKKMSEVANGTINTAGFMSAMESYVEEYLAPENQNRELLSFLSTC